MACLSLSSCTKPPAPEPLDPAALKPVTMPGMGQPAEPGKFMLLVRYKLATIEAPIGTVSASEELWSYLDEERVYSLNHASLGRNGLRVGLGKVAHWPEIAAALNRITGQQLSQADGVMVPGRPQPIVLKDNQDQQTIVIVNEDLTITLNDYPPGQNLLTLVCTLNPEDPSQIMITGVPQISTTRREMNIEQVDGNYSMQFRPNVYTFSQAAFRAMTPSKDIVVIGAGSQARREQSLGQHFLVHQREGVDFETVLVLIPEVVAEPLRQ